MAAIARALGHPLIGWQAQVVDVGLEVMPDGTPAYSRVIVTVPRQSGKSDVVDDVCIADLTYPGFKSWYTAQSGSAASRRFREETAPKIGRTPLRDMVKPRYVNGQESARNLANGAKLSVFPPKEDAIHGDQVDRATIDEAWRFDIAAGRMLEQAIIPAGRTRPNFALWIVSTAGTQRSAWLAEQVAMGRDAVKAGRTSGIAYFEWSAEGVDRDDLAGIINRHPGRALGSDQFIRDAFGQMDRDEFLRSFGNVWTSDSAIAIPAGAWADTAGTEIRPATGVVLGVDAARDGSRASIGAAWPLTTGRIAVALVDARPGVSWLATELAEIARTHRPARIVFDKASPAAAAIAAAGIVHPAPVGLNWADITKASALILDRIKERRLVHIPDVDLDAAARNAAQRFAGDVWAWGRKASAGAIDPLISVTLAAYRVDVPDSRAGKPRLFSG